ncbi:hypothetical protein ABPG74_011049 [Tetrahymena malaccensis]
MVKVVLKWGTKNVEAELDQSLPVIKFQETVYSLTRVPIASQKIIFKGTLFKPETDLSKLKLQEGSAITLMGAAEENQIQDIKEEKKFYEEMTPEERAKIYKEKTGEILPSGLVNLGNTCYMNSSIQCLKRINELKNFLQNRQLPAGQGPSGQVSVALQKLFRDLDKKGEAVQPINFVQNFMNAFPQFAEKEQGSMAFKQQDADECFQNVIQCLEPQTNYEDELGNKTNLIKDIFEIEYEVKQTNNDNIQEVSIKSERSKKLMCTIDNQSNPVNQLTEGIEVSLQGTIQKNGQDGLLHDFTETRRIKKLPSYLAIQMMRFFWKQKSESSRTEATKSKILRSVAFPKILDVTPYCTQDLQSAIEKGKDYEKRQQEQANKNTEEKFAEYKRKLEAEGKMIPEDTKALYKQFKEAQKEEEIRQHDENLYRPHGQGLDNGTYELVAVLTHQGRSADSGHYVGWAHKSGDVWQRFDDSTVTEVSIDEILDLRGGGDRHMAYYLIYRKQEIL